jgi:hypothetical protein
LRHFIGPVFFGDIFYHLVAAIIGKISVNIGRAGAERI